MLQTENALHVASALAAVSERKRTTKPHLSIASARGNVSQQFRSARSLRNSTSAAHCRAHFAP
eukprot:3398590-Lingulodinium_polyedra.AAC.1